MDRFKIELEVRIGDWREGGTSSTFALRKLQQMAGKLDGTYSFKQTTHFDNYRLDRLSKHCLGLVSESSLIFSPYEDF